MLCQKCHKNPATVRYAEVVDGKVTDLHLCGECLAKYQESAGSGFELTGPVSSTRHAPLRTEQERRRVRRTCPSCGGVLSRTLESGEVGCSVCYASFADDLELVLIDIHGTTRHVGKSPQVEDARVRLTEHLKMKRSLMRTAIGMENYEEAAVLRDEIKQLEDTMNAAEIPAEIPADKPAEKL